MTVALIAQVAFEHVQGPQSYRLAADAHDLSLGTPMVGLTRYGGSVGQLVALPREAGDEPLPHEACRRATDEDLRRREQNRLEAASHLARCRLLAQRHDLPMRVGPAFLSLDRRQLTFFFCSPGRVDFRNLLRDLVRTVSTPIRLEQVGERDVARMLGGFGRCGHEVCCRAWMPQFDPVSMRHAKLQELPLVPSQLGGLCGKLRCCLRFELDEEQPTSRPRRATDGTVPVKTSSQRWNEDEYAPL